MQSFSSGRPNVSRSASTLTGYPSILTPDPGELDDRERGESHVLDADPFALAVGVMAAREDVRRRQPHLGERGAVGAAADRRLLRLEPDPADGFLEVGDDLGM